MGPHAQGESPHASQHEPAVEGRRHCAVRRLNAPDPPEKVVFNASQHGTPKNVSVPAKVLCGGMDGEVGAQLERTLQYRRCPGVVAHAQRASLVCDRGHAANVGDPQQWVRRRLNPDEPRTGLDRVTDLTKVGHVHEGGLQAPPGENIAQQAGGPVVDVFGRDDVVPRGQGLEDAGGCGGAGREGRGRGGSLQLPQARFQRLPRRVVASGVDVSLRISEEILIIRLILCSDCA